MHAEQLFKALQNFGKLEDEPKDQFLSRYIFDTFLKNEALLSVNHTLYPKYLYRKFLSAEEGSFDLPMRMDNIILLYVDFDDFS